MQHDPHVWNPLAALSDDQVERLDAFERLLIETNQKINLISRSDESAVRLHHLVHSLSLSYKSFPAGSTVVDWGTGGGLPGIPLAVRFPKVNFCLVDSTRKKILAVRRMVRALDLGNVTAEHARAEKWEGHVDFAVSRATASLSDLWAWTNRASDVESSDTPEEHWTPGLLTLKGGTLSDEIQDLKRVYRSVEIELIPLQPILGDQFFRRKAIVQVTR